MMSIVSDSVEVVDVVRVGAECRAVRMGAMRNGVVMDDGVVIGGVVMVVVVDGVGNDEKWCRVL